MSGVLLAILIVLNLRNGFGLANVGGNAQTGVIGAILIGSVLAQNLIERRITRGSGAEERPTPAGMHLPPEPNPAAGPHDPPLRVSFNDNHSNTRRKHEAHQKSVILVAALALAAGAVTMTAIDDELRRTEAPPRCPATEAAGRQPTRRSGSDAAADR